jgi:hypothetical protein
MIHGILAIQDEIQGIVETLDELVQTLPGNKQEFLTAEEAKQQYGLKADLP